MDHYDTFEKNVIGNNNGNLLFSSAVHKLLAADGVVVKAHGLHFSATQATRVNEEFDTFVLPLANAFRPSFENQLARITEFIEALKIPTIMLSGGAQSGPDGTFDNLEPIRGTVKRFCRAILRTSSHITVRGERTAQYIRSLGFNDVLVIGCPSMTMNGFNHKVGRVGNLEKIAYNIESSKDQTGPLVADAELRFDATYFPQDINTMEMMLWGIDKYPKTRDVRLPLRSPHSQFQSGKAEFHVDPHSWITRMRDFDLSFGPRIHGNVIPILAGTPAVVLAHDSRTQELAEYHDIPHFRPKEVDGILCVEQVRERADFAAFNHGHEGRVRKVVTFLHENGLKTIYDDDQAHALEKYEKHMEEIALPGPLRTEWASMTAGERSRLKRQRSLQVQTSKLVAENTQLKKALARAASALTNMK